MELFNCPSCQQILWQPVTLACGHSFCKKCLKSVNRCQICKQRLKIRSVTELRCNTLLSNLLDKCLDMDTKVTRITRDLEDLISAQQYEEAGKVACKGIVMGKEQEGVNGLIVPMLLYDLFYVANCNP